MSVPSCPSNCSTSVPAVNFNNCAPEINNGNIQWIYFTNVGYALTDYADATEWTARRDQTNTAANAIRTLRVNGDFPVPGKNEKEISGGRIIQGPKDFSINFDVDETNIENYQALRALECETGDKLFWFETRDGLLFGDNSGIKASILWDMLIPRAYGDIILYPGLIKWKSQFHPARTTSPITH